MTITDHAYKRWLERFPELNLVDEYAKAKRRVGKKMRIKIRESCPKNTQYCTRKFNGRYMRMTNEGIVFVVAPPETIITVLDYRKCK